MERLMSGIDTEKLSEELRQFEEEKEKIRMLVGQVGGRGALRREKFITRFFTVLMLLLFMLDVSRHFLGLNIPFPPLFSIEVAVMLVSVKIIWMVHNQTRVEHFQFWILNSLEFRINDISKSIRKLNDKLDALSKEDRVAT